MLGPRREQNIGYVAYLGGEVEPQITVSGNGVLNQEWNLVGQAQLHGLGEASSLAEVCKVLEGECQGDGLGKLDINVRLGLLHVGAAS